MMGGHGALFAIVPTTVLLTVSYFVLLSLQKLHKGGLKIFGYIIVALLFLSAATVLGGGKRFRPPMMDKRCVMENKGCASKMNDQMKSPAPKEAPLAK